MIIPKLLAQLIPSASTLTTFYTVPGTARCHATTLFICNRSSSSTTFRLAVAPASATDANQHYLYYDAALTGNETKILELDLRLSPTDLVRIYTPGSSVAFNLFGIEEI